MLSLCDSSSPSASSHASEPASCPPLFTRLRIWRFERDEAMRWPSIWQSCIVRHSDPSRIASAVPQVSVFVLLYQSLYQQTEHLERPY
eukprot:03801_3